MSNYAENTNVSIERSRSQIEYLLDKFGASEFGYISKHCEAIIGFRYRNLMFRMTVKFPAPEEFKFTPTGMDRSVGKQLEMAAKAKRSRWRALALAVKAKLVAVEEEVFTFEEEFMPYLVVGEQTFAQQWAPRIEQAMESGDQLLLQDMSMAGAQA